MPIIIVLALAVCGIILWLIFKADPVSDAKKAVSAYCNCSEKYYDGTIKADEDFVNSFRPNNFKNRQEARNKLQELRNAVSAISVDCNGKAQANYTEKRNKYLTDAEQLKKFDFTYGSLLGTCNSGNQSKLISLNAEIENKISTIKVPGPDIKKIESDLIGRGIPGWQFTNLSIFEKCEILSNIEAGERLEYRVRLNLTWPPDNLHAETEVIVAYVASENGWDFNSVTMPDTFYKDLIYANSWIRIAVLNNTNINWDNSEKLVWKTSENGNEINTGPDQIGATIPYSRIYWIKSREGHDITVKFTYAALN